MGTLIFCFTIFFLSLLELAYFYKCLTSKFNSPYTLDVIFGKKGCGKSTTLNKLAFKYYSKGWHVFCDLNDSMQSFVTQIDASQLWKYKLPPNSVVFVGEANLHWDNRDFKDFPKPLQKYFRKQRHKRVKVILFSQTYDTDKKIRDLADRLYIATKKLKLWTRCTPYVKTPVIVPAKETRDTAKLTDDFVKVPFFMFQGITTFIPRWIRAFDSYEDDDDGYTIDMSDGKGMSSTGSCEQLPTSARRARHPSPAKPAEDASD